MKLTKVVENIITEDSGAPLRERIADLEKRREALQLALEHSHEDYELAVADCKKLSSECDQLKIRCDSLQSELAQGRSDAEKRISDLEAKVASAEARSTEIAIESKKSLEDFQGLLVQQLELVHDMYAEKIQSISSLCLAVSAEELRQRIT
jgi:chromosome segregation ATPase